MKKILLFAFMVFLGTIDVAAQEVDSLQTNTLQMQIDSLSSKLSQLQHDHDYLWCEHKLNCMQANLERFQHEVHISALSLQITLYHSKFDVELYISHKENYEAKLELFSTLKETVEKTQSVVNQKIESSNLLPSEKLFLTSNMLLFSLTINSIEYTFTVFRETLNAYKRLR